MTNTSILELPETWNKVLYADHYYLTQRTKPEIDRLLTIWYRDFINSHFELPSFEAGSVMFFRSLVRDDYQKMFELVYNTVHNKAVVVQNYKTKPHDGFLNIEASKSILRNKRILNFIRCKDARFKPLLYIRACMYKYVLDHFRKQPKPKAVIFFADMQPTEHLLALYFRRLGVPTVTLQHGLYVDYGDYDTVNRINYLHQPSQYFLSWGPQTSKLIAQHQPTTQIVECGKPLIFNADPPSGESTTLPYVSLLLDQKPFHVQNEQMIEIVSAFALRRGFDLRVRFHPSLPKAAILKKYPYMTEQLHFTNAEIVIGHTSSLLYEALALGCRVLRFSSEIPAVTLPKNYEFTNLSQLEAKSGLPQSNDLWQHYFTAIGNDALKNYGAFFDALLAGQEIKTA